MSTVSVDLIEGRIARVLSSGAVIAVVLLVIGVGLMVAGGIEADTAAYPAFDPARLIDDLVALRPEGFLWAGILVVIATPVIRVVGELVGFAIRGDRAMAAVAAAILVVVTTSVVVAIILEG
jgi:uncharacterized membrane protein